MGLVLGDGDCWRLCGCGGGGGGGGVLEGPLRGGGLTDPREVLPRGAGDGERHLL